MSNCIQCLKEFKPYNLKQKFCNNKCYWIYRKDNKMYPPSRKGTKLTEEHKKALSDWAKSHFNELSALRRGKEPWNKNKIFPEFSGKNHWNWKGGHVKHPDKRIRRSPEYKQWREAVYKRDDYTCQECFVKGNKIVADHIKPFAIYPELRTDISNGRTLCVDCHKKTPTYGRPKGHLEAIS